MSVVIWSKPNCSFCVKAKAVLQGLGLQYEERVIGDGWGVSDLLADVPTAKSVPQIFINEEYIGGYTQLTEYVKEKSL